MQTYNSRRHTRRTIIDDDEDDGDIIIPENPFDFSFSGTSASASSSSRHRPPVGRGGTAAGHAAGERGLRSLSHFLDTDLARLAAESQDILNQLGSYSELVTDVALDCAEAENLERADLLVNKVVPKLDDVTASIKSSNAALTLVAEQLREALAQEAAQLEEYENRMEVDGQLSQAESQPNHPKVKDEDKKKSKIPSPEVVAESFRIKFTEHCTANPPPAPTPDGVPTGTLAVTARGKMWELTQDARFSPGELDEDDDLMITAEKDDFRDPITAGTFVHPIRSNQCKHRFEDHAIREMIRAQGGRAECPVAGCRQYVREDQLERDAIFERKLKRHLAQLAREKEQGGDDYMELD